MSKKIWKNGEIISYEDAKVGIDTHALHYGSSVFEGIRAYKTPNGTGILKLKEHMERFIYSMSVLGMKSKYSVDELCQGVIDIVKASGKSSCYIRPLAYFAEGGISVLPSEGHPVDIIIFCLDLNHYTDIKLADIKISKYIRIHPQSTVCDAKLSGTYVNCILASGETRGTHYHESVMLDVDGNIAEAGAMNIFMVKDNEIITTPPGTILNGITRQIIIQIARDLGYKVTERLYKVDELMNADEVFLSGTAAELIPVGSVDDSKLNDSDHKITKQIKEVFAKLNKGEAYKDFLTYI
ncbi:branched-chain amino acid transaminase [Francisella sp. SYW-9]|uniref:branched-chain amino acid transaminase n=2 Tax=Thiotrichales TaxID=72273 RepID=UPI00123E1922|nr:branched-chain amino acid transaminase [Francisella sp. SYW-9]